MSLLLDPKTKLNPAGTPDLFTIPKEITDYLQVLDKFIDEKITPLQMKDDNNRFFDHRREWARTDFEHGGLPRKEWEELLDKMRALAMEAGHFRFPAPPEFGGRDGSNLAMAVIRWHLARKGLGLFNDLQGESSIVSNINSVTMLRDFGTKEQQKWVTDVLQDKMRIAFGLTEPKHGSDATYMETRAVQDPKTGDWIINGAKMWNSGMHSATHDMVFARTDGKDGNADGITCFIVPVTAPGFKVEEYLWTFNMPTDHALVSLKDVRVKDSDIFGGRGQGLAVASHFVHENRIRQAASSCGAAEYCIAETVKYAKERKPFGKPLASNQAIQWPLIELHTEATMLRGLIFKTAAEMDKMPKPEHALYLSNFIAMCNYRANRLCCDAADRAMQIHGGIGYSRHKPFEHIYRHHRRYRITEGSEEIQMRRVGQVLFGIQGYSSRNIKKDEGGLYRHDPKARL
ncbi:acyl-CoA dehydrogenase domain-containing protein [Hyaloraphidium curvatum]|nr:acyl-CoA dehydrogenase domain-containing protein [Hyaloraphidium curvatum]